MYTYPMPRLPQKESRIGVRLTAEGKRLLSLIASEKGVSEAAVVEMAIRLMAKSEGFAQYPTPAEYPTKAE